MKRPNEKAAVDFRLSTDPTVSSLRHSSESSTRVVTSTTPTLSCFKLKLPKFSGELLDWREFWSIFSARIEHEVGLTDAEKVTCLEDAMNN